MSANASDSNARAREAGAAVSQQGDAAAGRVAVLDGPQGDAARGAHPVAIILQRQRRWRVEGSGEEAFK